ncbi:MAG: hypothetical protein ACK5NY_00925 [Burkholderiaceae bacterium]
MNSFFKNISLAFSAPRYYINGSKKAEDPHLKKLIQNHNKTIARQMSAHVITSLNGQISERLSQSFQDLTLFKNDLDECSIPEERSRIQEEAKNAYAELVDELIKFKMMLMKFEDTSDLGDDFLHSLHQPLNLAHELDCVELIGKNRQLSPEDCLTVKASFLKNADDFEKKLAEIADWADPSGPNFSDGLLDKKVLEEWPLQLSQYAYNIPGVVKPVRVRCFAGAEWALAASVNETSVVNDSSVESLFVKHQWLKKNTHNDGNGILTSAPLNASLDVRFYRFRRFCNNWIAPGKNRPRHLREKALKILLTNSFRMPDKIARYAANFLKKPYVPVSDVRDDLIKNANHNISMETFNYFANPLALPILKNDTQDSEDVSHIDRLFDPERVIRLGGVSHNIDWFFHPAGDVPKNLKATRNSVFAFRDKELKKLEATQSVSSTETGYQIFRNVVKILDLDIALNENDPIPGNWLRLAFEKLSEKDFRFMDQLAEVALREGADQHAPASKVYQLAKHILRVSLEAVNSENGIAMQDLADGGWEDIDSNEVNNIAYAVNKPAYERLCKAAVDRHLSPLETDLAEQTQSFASLGQSSAPQVLADLGSKVEEMIRNAPLIGIERLQDPFNKLKEEDFKETQKMVQDRVQSLVCDARSLLEGIKKKIDDSFETTPQEKVALECNSNLNAYRSFQEVFGSRFEEGTPNEVVLSRHLMNSLGFQAENGYYSEDLSLNSLHMDTNHSSLKENEKLAVANIIGSLNVFASPSIVDKLEATHSIKKILAELTGDFFKNYLDDAVRELRHKFIRKKVLNDPAPLQIEEITTKDEQENEIKAFLDARKAFCVTFTGDGDKEKVLVFKPVGGDSWQFFDDVIPGEKESTELEYFSGQELSEEQILHLLSGFKVALLQAVKGLPAATAPERTNEEEQSPITPNPVDFEQPSTPGVFTSFVPHGDAIDSDSDYVDDEVFSVSGSEAGGSPANSPVSPRKGSEDDNNSNAGDGDEFDIPDAVAGFDDPGSETSPARVVASVDKVGPLSVPGMDIPYKFSCLSRTGCTDLRTAKTLALGDLHGSCYKLVETLLAAKLIYMPEEDAKRFAELMKDERNNLPNNLIEFIIHSTEAEREKHKTDFSQVLREISNLVSELRRAISRIKWIGGDRQLVLIGDVLGDRGLSDQITLEILEKLTGDTLGRIVRIASNHDHDVIEPLLNGKIERAFGEERLTEVFGTLGPGQAVSLWVALKLTETDMEAREELVQRYKDYLSNSKLMHYDPDTSTLYTHAPIDSEHIKSLINLINNKNTKNLENDKNQSDKKNNGRPWYSFKGRRSVKNEGIPVNSELNIIKYDELDRETLPGFVDKANKLYRDYIIDCFKNSTVGDEVEKFLAGDQNKSFFWKRHFELDENGSFVLDAGRNPIFVEYEENELPFKEMGVKTLVHGHDDGTKSSGFHLKSGTDEDTYAIVNLDQDIRKGCDLESQPTSDKVSPLFLVA